MKQPQSIINDFNKFNAFLTKHRCKTKFLINLRNDPISNSNLLEHCKKHNHYRFILYAFIWYKTTEEEGDFWSILNNKWIQTIDNHE